MGFALIPGDPNEVAAVRDHFRQVADGVNDARQKLTAAQAAPDGEWRGSGGDAFRSTLGDFPDKFGKVSHAFDYSAIWLEWYRNRLHELQAKQLQLAHKGDAARNNEQSLRRRKAQDDPTKASSWDSKIEAAVSEGSSLDSQASAIYEEWKNDVNTCRDRINEAADWAFDNWFGRYVVDDAGGALKGTLGVVGGVVGGVVNFLIVEPLEALSRIPGDLADFAEHPSWETLSHALGDITAVGLAVFPLGKAGRVLIEGVKVLGGVVGLGGKVLGEGIGKLWKFVLGGAKGGLTRAEQSGILRTAARGKGNFGLGSATAKDANILGRAWVGKGYDVARDGRTLVSRDKLRQYRPPSYKPPRRGYQANFERRLEGQTSKEWQSNGHLDITDLP